MNNLPIPPSDSDRWLPAARQYVADGLSPAERADFEDVLAQEQSAREALVEAMAENQKAIATNAVGPNARYRQTVRARLRIASRPSVTLFRWAAVAALVLGGTVLYGVSRQVADQPPVMQLVMDETPPTEDAAPDDEDNDASEATIFAELSNINRLEQVHRSHNERRGRSSEWQEHRSTLSPLRAGRILPIVTDE
jgi:hypothetical protein